ncbi:MAG: hypothetical protein J6B89_00570 [Bacilli bacterium]|nr:hypothetical protein [Bacilli bacterium]
MLSNEDLLNIIKEVCCFYKISYNDEKIVSQMKEYLIDIISSDDSNCLSYDEVLDDLDKYVFKIINDEFVKNTFSDRRDYISSDPLYLLSTNALVDMYSNDVEQRKRIADLIINKNMNKILRVANEYANSSVSINDLIQAGCLGVLMSLKHSLSSCSNIYQDISRCVQSEISKCASNEEHIYLCYDSVSNQMDNINNIINRLRKNQRFVLCYMYGLYDGKDHTLLETARAFCTYRGDGKPVSTARICEIKKRALLNIRSALGLLEDQVNMSDFTSDEISSEELLHKINKNHVKVLKESDYKLSAEIKRRYILKNKLGRELTLCEYLDCSYEQLTYVISFLSDRDRSVLYAMYGDDLRQPLDICVNNHYKYSKKHSLYHKMMTLLAEYNCKGNSVKKVYVNKI